MGKKLLIIGTIIFMVLSTICIYFLLNKNHNSDDWRKVSIGSHYYVSSNIELDLDGDKTKEKIYINKYGKNISINNNDYIVNKYLNEDVSNEYNINQYYFVDLNNDGLLEIIHKTFSSNISPSENKYTIYNYINNNLKEIGNISIMGDIPNEVYVKYNQIKFEYWPYESPDSYTKEIIFKLNI